MKKLRKIGKCYGEEGENKYDELHPPIIQLFLLLKTLTEIRHTLFYNTWMKW